MLVDTREPGDMRLLLDAAGVQYADATLESADYLMFDRDGHSLGIERKTDTDLIHTFGTIRKSDGVNRLYSQLERMRDQYDSTILLVEGVLDYDGVTGKVRAGKKLTDWQHASIQMMLFACQLRFDTKVLWVSNRGASVDILRMLEERALGGCVLRSQRENRDARKTAKYQVQPNEPVPVSDAIR